MKSMTDPSQRNPRNLGSGYSTKNRDGYPHGADGDAADDGVEDSCERGFTNCGFP